MNWQDIWWLAKSDYLKLLPIFALAFYLAFILYLGFPYPVHIDEWIHLALSEAVLRAHNTTYGLSIMYYRGLMYMMLMVSIVAGAGLMEVKNIRLLTKLIARLKAPLITKKCREHIMSGSYWCNTGCEHPGPPGYPLLSYDR